MPDVVHPSLDDLADLHEDLLPPDRSAELSAHVDSCATCSAAMAALDEVQQLLAASGSSPVSMPSSVGASINEALARASREQAAGVPSLAERRFSSTDELDVSARRRQWLRILGAAAAVVVIGFGVVSVLNNTSDDSDESSAQTNAGVGLNSVAGGQAGSGQDYQAGSTPRPTAGEALSLPGVNRKTLPGFARKLAQSADTSQRPPAVMRANRSYTQYCKPQSGAAEKRHFTALADVRWRHNAAAVAVDAQTRTVTVYACGGPASRLYSTSY